MPKPVRLSITRDLPIPPEEVGALILDLDNWSSFPGYGPLPGIRSATWLERTEDVVGSRIACVNTDGSTHVEEIVGWDLPDAIALRLGEFSKPLSSLASHFDERWDFRRRDGTTVAERSFELHPRNVVGRAVLIAIRPMLRRAVLRHLDVMTRREN